MNEKGMTSNLLYVNTPYIYFMQDRSGNLSNLKYSRKINCWRLGRSIKTNGILNEYRTTNPSLSIRRKHDIKRF